MTKKKTMKNIKTPNKFNIGGPIEPIATPESALGMLSKLTASPTVKPGELIQTWDPNFKSRNTLSGLFQNIDMSGMASGIASGIAGIASNAISQGRSTIGGDIVGTIGNAVSTVNPILGGVITMAGGAINNLYGASYNDANIEKVESDTSALNAFNSTASDTASLAREASSISKNFGNFNKDFIGTDGAFSNKIDNKYQELVHNRNRGEQNVINQLNNSATNIAASTLDNLERNYAAFGGPLFAYGGQTHGSDFTNGLMFINNGGTHENNPYEGVPISMDQEGNPNLVEEGEVVWNDYVFSDRLKVPKAVRTKYKLRGPKDMTFAEAIEKSSKESEERPNDPISMRGLEDILMHMAIEQETLKSKQQPKNTGKNKFNTGGDTNPYKSYSWIPGYDGGWFDNKGEYTQAYRDYVNAITKEQMLQAFNDNYNYYLNAANKGTDRYNAIANFYAANPNYKVSLTELSDDMFNRSKQLMLDGKPGFMHHVAAAMMNTPTDTPPQAATANRYFIRNADGTVTPMDEGLIPFEGLDENGRTWAELNPNYIFRGKQVRPQETIEGVPTTYTDYYYDLKTEEAPKENTTTPVTPPENLPTWMRYAPAIGHGALALTDMLGITNKPDYSNAEAIISAAKGIRSNPISFTPIGDYLTYNPFDTEYHANQLRAVSGATRRNIMNTSGGNRATAMAGVLASDNNTLNQLGDLYRKAAEYNLEQRQKVTDFNRATNMFNKEGAFKADAANQSADLQARGLGFEGMLKGYAMKEQDKLMSDQAKAANISGLLTSLGNIGYENANRNMMNWGMATGTWAPSQWKYDPLTGKPVNQNG